MNKHIIVLLVLLLSFAPLEAKLVSKAPIGNFGSTLRLTHIGKDPKTFNTWVANDATSSYYGDILFDGLLTSNPDTDEVEPLLAESYEVLDGGKKIIIKLRDDIFWTDGKKISVEDVLFTWNDLIRDKVAVSSLRDILMVEGEFPSVKKLDDRTIEFKTKKVFAPFLKTVGISIAPKHHVLDYFEKKSAKSFEEKQKAFNAYLDINTKPEDMVTSGAFKLSRLKRGERIELVKNSNYYIFNKEGKRLPYLNKIVYTYVTDKSADVFKFLAGESYTLNVDPENAALIKSLEDKYNFKLYEMGPSSGTMFLWFNMSQNLKEPKFTWFNDKNFRKAVSFAIDRKSIVSNVYQGLGKPLFTAESLRSPFLNEKLKDGHPRDIKKAKKLLLDSAFRFKDKKLIDQKGNKVEFDLFTNAGAKQRELMSTIIVDNLNEIGIKVNFKVLEFNNLVSRIMAGKNYEACVMGFTGSNEPNGGANVWKSDGRLHSFDVRTGDLKNPIREWEKEIDKLFISGVQTMVFEERKKIYDRFQEIVYEEMPYIYLVSPDQLSAASNKLGNIRKTKYGGLLPRLYEVYIK